MGLRANIRGCDYMGHLHNLWMCLGPLLQSYLLSPLSTTGNDKDAPLLDILELYRHDPRQKNIPNFTLKPTTTLNPKP